MSNLMSHHITNKELQEEFYQKVVKERFPGVDRKHAIQMTSAVYKKLAKEMSEGRFPKVRIKYLGIFQVLPKRASYYLEQLKTSLKKQVIEAEVYFKYREATVGYIKDSLTARAKVLKEDFPEELFEVLLHKHNPEEGRTNYFYSNKRWLK